MPIPTTDMRLLARLTLPTNMPRKSNSREVVKREGKTKVIKSAKALHWVDSAREHTPREALHGHAGPILIIATCYYANRQSDLSLELAFDALQTQYQLDGNKRLVIQGKQVVRWFGVYRDDVQVGALFARKLIDKENPRVELSIFACDSVELWGRMDHDQWVRFLIGDPGEALVAPQWSQDDIGFENV